MSIVTLKRKVLNGNNSRMNPISGNNKNIGFNINGNLRIGYHIEQPYRNYLFKNMSNSTDSRNVNTYEKENNCSRFEDGVYQSVINTRGLLSLRNSRKKDHINCCRNDNSNNLISNSNNLLNTYEQYIDYKKQNCLIKSKYLDTSYNITEICNNRGCSDYSNSNITTRTSTNQNYPGLSKKIK